MKAYPPKVLLFALFACVFSAHSALAQSVNLLGDTVIWHKITLELTGPTTSESATPNPFTDMRMDVTFTHPESGTEYVVPGFFAADGDPANSSASSGNKWHCYLRPNQSGTWNYSVSFRQGTDVATSSDAAPGTVLSPYDGVSGTFSVSATNTATAPDLRAKGRLRYVGKHHLQFEGTGEYFLKFGPDSPENPLEYVDFDNTPSQGFPADVDGNGNVRPPAGFIKDWSPHQSDYNNDGETWQSGKGSELLGAINYVASTGANSISTLLYNLYGDGRRTFPYTDTSTLERFDCSKLDQWEIIFNHAEQKGLHLHFKLFENENGRIHDGGGNTLGPERKLYYREMIARFGHHLALNWNISEEINMGGEAVIEGSLKYFEDNDPWQSNRVFHTAPSAQAKLNRYTQYLGDSEMTGVSMQIELSATSSNVFDETKEWVDKSAAAGRPWICANDEQGPGNLGIRASEDGTRIYTLWGNIMAGGAGVEYYVGGRDLTMQDYRLELDAVLEDADIAVNGFFYGQNIPFWIMRNNDALVSSSAAHCLTDDSNIFVVYLREGGTTNLDLTSLTGTFEVQWFDPRNGGNLQNGSVTTIQGGSSQALGTAPNNATEDWAILVKKNEAIAYGERWLETGGRVVIEVENTETPYGAWVLRAPNAVGYPAGATGTGHLEYMGPWSGSEPHANSTSLVYQFKITQAGKYHLRIRAHKRLNEGDGGDKHNDCFVKMEGDFDSGSDAVDIAALIDHSKIYGGNADSWGVARNLDNGQLADHTPAIYDFKAGEVYTFIVSGRSNQFNIDRILFHLESLSAPNDSQFAGYPESPRDSSPLVSAGPDREITLPNAEVILYGSASDDGSIVSYNWSLVSGTGSVLMLGNDTPYLTASSLEAGSYVFRLTVTDDEGNESSDDATVTVLGAPDQLVIEFDAPFTNGELNGQQNWNSGLGWIVDTANNGSTTSNTNNTIAVLDRPLILAAGESFACSIDFEFTGTYALPTSHVYTLLTGLKADSTTSSISTGSHEPDINVQLLPTAGNYRMLSNYSGISGASNLSDGPDGGDQMRLNYELTVGASAADTTYSVRLQNLSDGTDSGTGTITEYTLSGTTYSGIHADVYNALVGSGAYLFFQRINPAANGSGLSEIKINTVTLDASAFGLTGFAKFENDYALTLGQLGDDDQDSLNNLLEYAFGGDPKDNNSTGKTPKISQVTPDDPDTMVIEFRRRKDADNGLSYQVEWNDDLNTSWHNYTDPVNVESETADFDLVTVSVPMIDDAYFVRVRVDKL